VKPHSWTVVPDPDVAATRIKWPARDSAVSYPVSTPIVSGEDILWVRCSGCGAFVTTYRESFPDRCHVGWRMSKDCDEALVERIMEE